MDSFFRLLEFLARYAFAFAVTAAVVLLLPDSAVDYMNLSGMRSVYKGPIWIVLILSLAVSLTRAVPVAAGWLSSGLARVRTRRRILENERTVIKRLYSLDRDERLWMKACLWAGVQSVSATEGNRVAQSLHWKGIVIQGHGHALDKPFHFPEFVWEYLQAHRRDFLSEEEENDPQLEHEIDAFHTRLHTS